MAQSPEYPDLPFHLPAAYGKGRDGRAVRYIVVHYTAGSEGPTSAEDGAAYDQRRTDGTSTHYFVDSNSVFQEVCTWDRANAAFSKGNRLGIQYELCGTQQTKAQWLDAASDAMLWNAAKQMARDARKYGIVPRRLTLAETRAAWYSFPNGPRGFVGHGDVTMAYPEDGGSHMDPGADFPWYALLDRVKHFLDGGTSITTEGTDDVTGDQWQAIEDMLWRVDAMNRGSEKILGGRWKDDPVLSICQPSVDMHKLQAEVKTLQLGVVTPEALKAALLDPDVRAALVTVAREGAQLAEDS